MSMWTPPKRQPEWKRGLRRLQTGMYADERGGLHLDLLEMIVAAGYPPTPENIEQLRLAALAMARDIRAEFHETD